jgi:uncharacterized small protein (DUF1192 family)
MSSKIEACKTCNGTGIEYDGAGHTCTACNGIAAPVVERQPVDAILLENCEEVTVQDYGRGYFATDDCVAQLYTAPPELAELQATIARLTAEIERLKTVNSDLLLGGEIVDKMCEEIMDERDQLKTEIDRLKSESFESLYNDAVDEIERLKGWQGEAVAVVIDERAAFEADVLSQCPGADVERIGDGRNFYRNLHVQEQFIGWMARACLNKVKELNQ